MSRACRRAVAGDFFWRMFSVLSVSEPGRAVGLREHEAGDASALWQHERAGGDLGVVDGCAHASPPAAGWT